MNSTRKFEVKLLYPGCHWAIGEKIEYNSVAGHWAKVIGHTPEGMRLFSPIGIQAPGNYPEIFKEVN